MISKSTNIGRGRGKELEEDVEEENVGENMVYFQKKCYINTNHIFLN